MRRQRKKKKKGDAASSFGSKEAHDHTYVIINKSELYMDSQPDSSLLNQIKIIMLCLRNMLITQEIVRPINSFLAQALSAPAVTA